MTHLPVCLACKYQARVLLKYYIQTFGVFFFSKTPGAFSLRTFYDIFHLGALPEGLFSVQDFWSWAPRAGRTLMIHRCVVLNLRARGGL